jgi:DNA-binding NarL/FixJ family response regulator
MKRPRVIIADDHEMVRYTLRRVIEAEFDVIGEAATGREAVAAAEHLRPDVVLLDVTMPVMGGFEAARVLRATMPDVPIVFISDHADPAYADEAFRLGAQAYVVKRTSATELCPAIRIVLEGKSFRSSAVQSLSRAAIRPAD